MCVHVNSGTCVGQMRVSGPLDLEHRQLSNADMGTEDRTQVLWKSCAHSIATEQSHLLLTLETLYIHLEIECVQKNHNL